MYTFTPKRSNKISGALVALLFASAAVSFIFPSLLREMAYAGLLQSLGLLFIIAALAVSSRYFFKSFTYEVRERREGALDLDVVETQGKRRYTVCRVGVSNIESVEKVTRENRDAQKAKCAKRKKFAYVPDIAPAEALYVYVTECGEPLVLILAYDETLEKILAPDKK